MEGCKQLSLCEDFGHLRGLKKLNLCRCRRLTKLPEAFSDLSNLEELEMNNCHSLLNLCDGFCRLGKLQRLDLRGCHSLIKLPQSFPNFSKGLVFRSNEEDEVEHHRHKLVWT